MVLAPQVDILMLISLYNRIVNSGIGKAGWDLYRISDLRTPVFTCGNPIFLLKKLYFPAEEIIFSCCENLFSCCGNGIPVSGVIFRCSDNLSFTLEINQDVENIMQPRLFKSHPDWYLALKSLHRFSAINKNA